MTPENEKQPFAHWCIAELLGHRRLGGFVTEVTVAGAGMLRIDVPKAEGEGFELTQIFNPSSLYCLTPCSEEAARAVANANRPRPVQSYELPTLPRPGRTADEEYDPDDRDDEEAWRPR